jgi:alanine transaminase
LDKTVLIPSPLSRQPALRLALTRLQVGVDLLVSPPQPGDESYDLFHSQTTETLSNLKQRSLYMSERFNALEGMSCVPADGAMYLLPKIDMPKKAVEEAEKRGKKADVMYTLDMLGESARQGVYPLAS